MPIKNNLDRMKSYQASQERRKEAKRQNRKSRAKPGAKMMRNTIINGRWGIEMVERGS